MFGSQGTAEQIKKAEDMMTEDQRVRSAKREMRIEENQTNLEWGIELGQMSWDEAQAKITELNAKLEKGEKPWRLPSMEELGGIAEQLEEHEVSGFNSHTPYWSSTKYEPSSKVDQYDYYGVSTKKKGGSAFGYYKHNTDPSVRLVR